MNVTKHIALIVSVDRLWPHDGPDEQGNDCFAFTMNLTTSLAGLPSNSQVASNDVTALKLWDWGSISGITLWAKSGSAPALSIPGNIIPLSNPLQQQPLTALQNTMNQRVTTFANDAFLWDPVNPKGDETPSATLFRHFLASTSNTPAPVPYALNLAVCFRVKKSDIPTAILTAADAVLLAVPSFTAGTDKAVPTDPTSTAPVAFPDGNSPMWQWGYAVDNHFPVNSNPIYAYTVSVDLARPDTTNTLIDLSRFWILSGSRNADSTDWATKLADAVADAWDLPRLLLNAAPGLIQSGYMSNPQAYWDAIVVCLRDRANAGWLDSPDSAGLLRFATVRAAQQQAIVPDSAIVDGWVRSLRSQLRHYESEQYGQTTGFDQWTGALAAAIPDFSVSGKLPALHTSKTGNITGATSGPNGLVIASDDVSGLRVGDFVQIRDSALRQAHSTFAVAALTTTTFTINGTFGTGSSSTSQGTWTVVDFTPLERIYNALGDNRILTTLVVAMPGLWSTAFAQELDSLSSQTTREDFSEPVAISGKILGIQSNSAAPATLVFTTDSTDGLTNGSSITVVGCKDHSNDGIWAIQSFTPPTTGVSPTPGTITVKTSGGVTSTDARGTWTSFVKSGALDLSDGSTWVITVGSVSLQSGTQWDGLAFSILLNDYSSSSTVKVPITVKQRLDNSVPTSPKAYLDFQLAGDTSVYTFLLPSITVPYHVRIQVRRDTTDSSSVGNSSAFEVTLQVSVSNPQIRPITWETVAGPKMLNLGMPLREVSVAVSNDSRGQAALTFAPPSAISLRGASLDDVLADWDSDTSLNKAYYAWTTLGAATIVPDFPNTDPTSGINARRRLALANISRIWPLLHTAMMSSVLEIDGLTSTFRALLTAAISARLNLAGEQSTSPYCDYLPAPKLSFTSPADDALVGALTQEILNAAKALAANLTSPPANDPADTALLPNSQALVIQFDRCDSFSDSDPVVDGELDDDPLRRIAGVGVFMQQALPPNTGDRQPNYDDNWYALHSAAISCAYDDTNTLNYETEVSSQAFASARVSYRDGAKQPMVTYDNNPVSARSVLAGFADSDHQSVGITSQDGDDSEPAILRYDAISNTNSPWFQLPALKTGQNYRFICTVIGNGGTLAKEVSGAHPAEMVSTNHLPHLLDNLGNCVRQVTYLRHVGIGLPRLSPGVSLIPAYPIGTAPLAREMEFNAVTQNAQNAYFFYNTGSQAGQLSLGSTWSVTIPRLIQPGLPYPTTAAYAAAFGIQGYDGHPVMQSVLVKIVRQGKTLSAIMFVGPAGSEQQSATVTTITNSLDTDSQAIDLRLQIGAGAATLLYRVSDVYSQDNGWQPSTAPPLLPLPTKVPIPNSLTTARVVITLSKNASSDPFTSVATFGLPQLLDPSTNSETPAPRNAARLLLVGPPVGDQEPQNSLVPPSVSFPLRIPAIDLTTWDRWYAMDLWTKKAPSPDEARAQVWARVHQFANKNIYQNIDFSIDDPAVSGLVVELVPLLAEPINQVSAQIVMLPRNPAIPAGNDPYPKAVSTVQSQPVQVSIQVTAANARSSVSSTRWNLNGQQLTITVVEGEIWEMRVYPAVPESFFNVSTLPGVQRFPATFAADCPRYTPPPPAPQLPKYCLFPPWRLVVEAVTTQIVLTDDAVTTAEETLFNAVRVGFEEGPSTTSVSATFAKNAPATGDVLGPRRFRYVTRVDLARQVWRWRGRPVDPFPFEGAVSAPDQFPPVGAPASHTFNYPLVWDAEGFGDRDAMDLLETSTGVHVTDPEMTLFQQDLTDDPRALYYRFSARAVSRYAPLFAAQLYAQMFDLRAPQDTSQGNAWKRLFVPCRFALAVPRPVIKLVVPLTQGEQEGVQAPGLLAVLDEASFHFGGLAEIIEAEIVKVDYSPTSTSWPEFGPDPIVTGNAYAGGPPPQPPPPTDALNLPIIGPVGTTFDTEADAPAFVASMLVVQAPSISLAGIYNQTPLAWYFARVRFRRVLLREAMDGYLHAAIPVDFSQRNPWQIPLTLESGADTAVTLARVVAQPSNNGTLVVNLGSLQVNFIFSNAGLELSASMPSQAVSELYATDPTQELRPLEFDMRVIFQRDPPPTALIPISSATESGRTVTITTSTDHGFSDRQQVMISGISPSGYDGLFPVSVIDSKTFKYAAAGGLGAATLNNANACILTWHVSVAFRFRGLAAIPTQPAIPSLGAWQLLYATQWPVGQALPTAVGLSWSGSQVPAPFVVEVADALVSPFTEPLWAQFLPDSNRLIPQWVVANPKAAGISWVPTTYQSGTSTASELMLQFVFNKDGGMVPDDWQLSWPSGKIVAVSSASTTSGGFVVTFKTDATVPQALVGAAVTIAGCDATGADGTWAVATVGNQSFTVNAATAIAGQPGDKATWSSQFSYQVLLTETVVDITGRPGQERYLGLFAPYAEETTLLRNLHTSPILLAAGEKIQNLSGVRVRVVQLQLAGSATNTIVTDGPNLGEAAWNAFFGPAKAPDPRQAADAAMRIVAVSQPVDLLQKVVTT